MTTATAQALQKFPDSLSIKIEGCVEYRDNRRRMDACALPLYTLWVKKGRHYTLVHIFAKYC